MRLCSALWNHISGKASWEADLQVLQWQIDKIAELTQRVLAGESPAAIPITEEGGYRTVYDWKELKRWRIPESSLPAGSILINKELNLFERYKKYIIRGRDFPYLSDSSYNLSH